MHRRSVSVDFQLYVTFLPVIVFIYSWRPVAGWLALSTATAITFGLSCWAVADAQVSALLNSDANSAAGLVGNYWKYYYTRTWARAPAFLIGIALGFALISYERTMSTKAAVSATALPSSEKSRQAPEIQATGTLPHTIIRIARLVLPSQSGRAQKDSEAVGPAESSRTVDISATLVMMFALASLGLLWYIPADHYARAQSNPLGGWSRVGMEVFTAVSRPLWSAALAVVLYLCAVDRGGALHYVLSHPLWMPYARVSYCAYLLHPIIIMTEAYSSTAPARFTAFTIATTYTSTLVLVAAASAIMYLLVEAPCAAVEQALIAEVVTTLRRSADKRAAVHPR